MNEDVGEGSSRVADIDPAVELHEQSPDFAIDALGVVILVERAVLEQRLIARVDRCLISFVIDDQHGSRPRWGREPRDPVVEVLQNRGILLDDEDAGLIDRREVRLIGHLVIEVAIEVRHREAVDHELGVEASPMTRMGWLGWRVLGLVS